VVGDAAGNSVWATGASERLQAEGKNTGSGCDRALNHNRSLRSAVGGWKAACPTASDNIANRDEDTMTGGGFLVMIIPPMETGGGMGAGRDTTTWNFTWAPSTGWGGVAESVARTVTGWKLWPTGRI